MSSLLDQDIKYLKGVGPVRAAMLGEELKVFTLGDFIHTFPYKYVDRTMVHTIVNLTEDMPHVQLAGTLLNLQKVGEGRSVAARPILIIPTTDSLRKPPRNSRNF